MFDDSSGPARSASLLQLPGFEHLPVSTAFGQRRAWMADVASLLFIDDEIPLLYMMTSYFDALGYEVAAARDADEAQQLLGADSYSVVISDLELCDAHQRRGFDLLGEVRRLDPRTRTILLTAYGSAEARRQAAELGVDVVLDKPHSLKQLADTVARLIEPNATDGMRCDPHAEGK